MMLAVAPDLVKMDRADGGLADEAFYDPANLPRSQIDCFTLGIKHFSPNGVLGDPRGAEAEIGEQLMDVAVETLVEAINNVVG